MSPSDALCLLRRGKAAAAAALDEAGLGGKGPVSRRGRAALAGGRVGAGAPVRVPTAAPGHLQHTFSGPAQPASGPSPAGSSGLGGGPGAWEPSWFCPPGSPRARLFTCPEAEEPRLVLRVQLPSLPHICSSIGTDHWPQ